MEKSKILDKYKNEQERLLISKLFDKILMTEKQNKIQYTDFLSPIDLKLLENVLKSIKFSNYIIYGALENAQRNVIIIYPHKLEEIFKENKFDYNSICNCIRITNIKEQYEHKIYLGGLIKLGVKREKIGDIVVFDNGADIVVNKDVTKFLISNLQELTRFKNSNIDVIDIKNITQKEQEFKEIRIIVSSLRLDNIVAELSKTSRSKAGEILKQERVLVNYRNETKNTKVLKNNDLITIRGVGKFIIDDIVGSTRSGKFIVIIKGFI